MDEIRAAFEMSSSETPPEFSRLANYELCFEATISEYWLEQAESDARVRESMPDPDQSVWIAIPADVLWLTLFAHIVGSQDRGTRIMWEHRSEWECELVDLPPVDVRNRRIVPIPDGELQVNWRTDRSTFLPILGAAVLTPITFTIDLYLNIVGPFATR